MKLVKLTLTVIAKALTAATVTIVIVMTILMRIQHLYYI